MSESLLLSAIFIAMIFLAGVVGANQGIARGFVTTSAILLGSELALWWSNNIADNLSDLFDISDETAQFLSSAGLLLLIALFLGYVGSQALRLGIPTSWGRVLGGALGAANGALLIAMALRYFYLSYDGHLISDPLDDSIVTRVLWQNFDWFILLFVAIALCLLLFTRATNRVLYLTDLAVRLVAASPPIPPPPLPSIATATRSRVEPLAVEAPSDIYRATVNGSEANAAPSQPLFDESAIYAKPGVNPSPEQEVVVERMVAVEVETMVTELPSARNKIRFCPNCGMTLDASDRFCPDCGYTL